MTVVIEELDPYIGPRFFKQEQSDRIRFFGRNRETDDIVSLILGHNLVLVYAASGAGKTSIFNAKVIPTLKEEYGSEVLPVVRVGITTSDEKELGDLDSLIKLDDPSLKDTLNIFIFNILQALKDKTKTQIPLLNQNLSLFLKDHFPIRKNNELEGHIYMPQILIIDQFEELFKFNPGIFEKHQKLFDFLKNNWYEQKKGFFRQIIQALNENPSLRIVFIMREEHLAELDPFSKYLPEMLKPRFRLERLRKDAALSAIRGPIQSTHRSYYENSIEELNIEIQSLVDELLKIRVETPTGKHGEIVGEFIEPIQLQVVCRRWWHERGNKKVSMEDLTNVDRALEDFYEEAILNASRETHVNEERIRRWCQEKLITSSGTRSTIHRGIDSTSGISNKVVDILESKYLIRRESRSGALWYELTHDRLIKPIIDSNTRWKRKNKTSTLQLVAKLENQIILYSRKARYNKFRFQLFQIITLIASAIIPIVNIIDVIDFPVRIISSVIGGIIALVIGVSELRKFLENWMFYRTTTELLKREKYFYENNAEKYSNLDEDEKVQLLVERVESIAPSNLIFG